MNPISDPNELRAELQQLIAYAGSERPSRARLARDLEGLSRRVAASQDKTAAMDARAITNALFSLRNKEVETAWSALKGARAKWERIGPAKDDLPDEADEAYQLFRKAFDAMEECVEELGGLFKKMGWR